MSTYQSLGILILFSERLRYIVSIVCPGRLPDDISTLQEIMHQSQGCILLLMLKQHLKDMYGMTDR